MPIPTVPSWAWNDPVESSKLQAMCDAISYLLYRGHGTYGQTTTAQTIANDTDTPIEWNVNVRQYLVSHSTVTDKEKITPGEPGLWLCVSTVQLQADADGYRKLWFRQNGSGVEGSVQLPAPGGGALSGVGIATLLYFNGSTDYVEALYRQTGGSALDLGFGEFNPRMSVTHLSGLV